MSARNPVNPIILRWARKTQGLSVDDVVKKLNRKRISAETIIAWEEGSEYPSYIQLERLAYEIYKRPLALFFFPEPPDEETLKQSFRTLSKYELDDLIKPRWRFLIRKARVMQLNLTELFEDVNPASKQIIRDISYKPDIAVERMVADIRRYLKIDLSIQTEWKDEDNALKAWRNVLEEHGVFVFKDAFKDENLSGFCLYDEHFPIIYVNNSRPPTHQIFTLFHELAHLIFKTGGVDLRQDKYIEKLDGNNRRIEVLCNRFAGEFLVPNDDFDTEIAGRLINEELIRNLANYYHVSREVILRKIRDRNLVDQEYYDEKVESWAKSAKKRSGTGGFYYNTQGAYLGERYLGQAFSRYYQKKISIEQLANYLGVKVKSVPGMEGLLFKKGAIA